MILIDTSVIVALLDKTHRHHRECVASIVNWAAKDELAISSVTYAELAAGGRTREAVDEDVKGFVHLELDFDSSWRAGRAARQYRSNRGDEPVLPDFFIRAQAAVLNLPHLTNDRRRLASWPDVDFLVPEST